MIDHLKSRNDFKETTNFWIGLKNNEIEQGKYFWTDGSEVEFGGQPGKDPWKEEQHNNNNNKNNKNKVNYAFIVLLLLNFK